MTSPTTRTYVNCSAISSTNKASRTTTSSTGTCSKSYVLLPLGIMYSGWPVLWKTWKCQGICQLSGKCQVFYEVGECWGGGILSGKSGLKLFIVSCIFVSIQVFSTSTGMIWVTLHLRSATNCRENVKESFLDIGGHFRYTDTQVLHWEMGSVLRKILSPCYDGSG